MANIGTLDERLVSRPLLRSATPVLQLAKTSRQ
jgi:hypothetical protein